MRKFRFFNIQWDTDGRSPSKLNLPSSVDIDIDDVDFDADNEGADKLSDKFGFCVFSFEFEILAA